MKNETRQLSSIELSLLSGEYWISKYSNRMGTQIHAGSIEEISFNIIGIGRNGESVHALIVSAIGEVYHTN